jgi:hypothetical protein
MRTSEYATKIVYKHWNNTGLTFLQALDASVITMTYVTAEAETRHVEFLNEVLNILEQWQKKEKSK